jgi:clan AA aspartic protease
VTGHVDDDGRALLEIAVGPKTDGPYVSISTWIDTAFDGHLVFSKSLIEQLKLEPLVETEAILADGSKVTLETFVCFLEWFGERVTIQVIANEGRFPLLGTGLLEQKVLHIDYARKTLSLD